MKIHITPEKVQTVIGLMQACEDAQRELEIYIHRLPANEQREILAMGRTFQDEDFHYEKVFDETSDIKDGDLPRQLLEFHGLLWHLMDALRGDGLAQFEQPPVSREKDECDDD